MSETKLLLADFLELRRKVRALETAVEHPGFAASDVARKSLTLAQFAATTSAELAGVISDETGYSSGAFLVFSISPVFGTQISTPAIKTVSGALTVTPAAGSNFALVLSTTGDFVVNTNQLYVDTSAAMVGVNTSAPGYTMDVRISDTGTNTVPNVLRVDHRLSSGTPANGIGAGIIVQASSATVADRWLHQLQSSWSDATDATRTSLFTLLGVNSAAQITLLTIAGNGLVTIPGALQVDGNTTLGNASTDTITHAGRAIFRTAGSDPQKYIFAA